MSTIHNNPAIPAVPEVPTLANVEFTTPRNISFSVERYDASRLLDSDSARKLGEIFRKVYGQGYPCEAFDNPEVFNNQLKRGEWLSIVVRDPQGQPVGHAAVIPYGGKVAELGRLFIDPNAQGHGLGKILVKAQVELAEELNRRGELELLVIEPVMTHQISQKLYSVYPSVTTGVFDRKYTDFFGLGERESVLRLTHILSETPKQERSVYLPSCYKELAEGLYAALGCARTLKPFPSVLEKVPAADSWRKIDTIDFKDFGVISVTVAPGRLPLQVVQDAREQFELGATYVSVRVDITHPGSLDQLQALRADGFYFAALEPHPPGEYLVVQKLSPEFKGECCPTVKSCYQQQSTKLLDEIRRTQFVQ